MRLFVYDPATGNCDLRQLVPYTGVTSADGSVVITASTGADGQPLFDLSASVDINVSNFSYDPASQTLTITETDGQTHSVNISDLVDVETVTTLVSNADGSFTYTSENGTVTNIPSPSTAQQTLTSISANGTSIDYTDEAGDVTSIDIHDVISATCLLYTSPSPRDS